MKIKNYKDWKISTKIASLVVFAAASFFLTLFLYTLPSLRTSLENNKKEKINHLVELAYSVFDKYYSEYKTGLISLEEAQESAKKVVKNMRFGENDYFWIMDKNANMIMHPINPALDGQSVIQKRDPLGKYLFKEMVDVVREHDHGFVEYMWPKPGYSESFDKISYVTLFKPWGWIVGSGIYSDDIDHEIASTRNSNILLVLLTSLLVISGGYYIASKIAKPIRQLESASIQLASGAADVELDYDSRDEIGKLTDGFKEMSDKIKLMMNDYNGLAAPVMMIDKEFNISYINKAGSDIVGRDQKSLLGQKCYDHFKTKHCQTENCACFKAMGNNKIEQAKTIANPNNKEMPILYTGAPRKDKEGNIIGAIEFITDITENVKYEKYLENNVHTILDKMEKFAEGDLTVSLTNEKEGDLISELFDGFNRTVEKIRYMVLNVTEAIDATASASTQISSSTEQMASGAQEQSTQASEVASSVEQMSTTIIETTKNSSLAAEMASKAGEIARNGEKVISDTIEGIVRISEVVNNASETVLRLGNSSEQIGEIIQVINEIADQTNLLALNAAIEAARAGEHGRGFAVVADEVRKLAERTTKATKEIADKIKTIQTDTTGAVDSINRGTEEVEKGKELAMKSGDSLKEIMNATEKVIENIRQVASANEELSLGSEQISRSIDGINSIVQQSASSATQIAGAAEDLSRLTENLDRLIKAFKVENISVDQFSHSLRPDIQLNAGKRGNNALTR